MFIGILYLFLTFLICFILVVVAKLIILGFKSLRKLPDPPAEEKKTEEKPEPVYYIVEKKRAKKARYTEPKQFEFKK